MSLSGIPDAPDESCRDRETVRLPRSTSKEIQRLVEEGRYPNRSAAIRAGVRLLIDHESGAFGRSEASGHPGDSGETTEAGESTESHETTASADATGADGDDTR
ncbi:ribbon-helix-helix domain-containing protein [Salinirubrum litoreum]|uniref:Ribbon-helix-helix domain-containing protein n=1 Tax=Salinirubrum litoreum TaxID=1126234 RepID=A0ABD5R805_9EURY|nr:ribbon-helix-helix domain-containing protein [Salinirubrum litoreum]